MYSYPHLHAYNIMMYENIDNVHLCIYQDGWIDS